MATTFCTSDMVSVIYDSPIGPIRITADPLGIVEVDMQFGAKYHSKQQKAEQKAGSNYEQSRNQCCLTLEQVESSTSADKQLVHLRNCIEWFNVYFKGDFDKLKHVTFPQLKPFASDHESECTYMYIGLI